MFILNKFISKDVVTYMNTLLYWVILAVKLIPFTAISFVSFLCTLADFEHSLVMLIGFLAIWAIDTFQFIFFILHYEIWCSQDRL
jgi:hypothetical protein